MPGKKKSSFNKYIKLFWFVVLTPLIILVTLVVAASMEWFGKLPTFEDLENPKSNLATEIYSADGILMGKYYYQNRSNVHYRDLSPNLIHALKATEDIRFEEHSGVDIRGLVRVLTKTVILRSNSSGGGSTLTQQLAKNLFHTNPNSKWERVKQKLQEWIIAVRLEKSYTKEEILAMYLNTVEFGQNTFGIKSASRTFFNKTPDKLNIQESAMLVGLLQAPTRYSPIRNPKTALWRRGTVLTQMFKYNFLKKSEYDSISKIQIQLHYQSEDHNEGLATYFREVLRGELMQWCRENPKKDGSTYNIYKDGLHIYTTLDSRMQRYAEEAVKEHMTDLQKQFRDHWKGKTPWAQHPEVIEQGMKTSPRYIDLKQSGVKEDSIKKIFNTKTEMTVFSWHGEIDTSMTPLDSIKYYKTFLQTGFMSMDPHTGYVKAWVGGNDYRYFQYDHVKQGKRQVGSTFKPFLYTLAMQEGYSPCYKVPNIPVTIQIPGQPAWTPKNAEPEYGGMMTLKEALANSINCISAYLMKQFGPQAMIGVARKMGITSPIDPVPAICLGTPDLSVYEMVGAYGTFANKGVWTEPVYITRIEDKNGLVLKEYVPRKVEAISEETAYLMLNLLQGVVQYGTSVRLRYKYGFTQPMGGKTGTTQEYSDGWYMGVTPDLVSGCWVGCEDRSIHFRSITLGQGASMALPIWALYMKKVYADKSIGLYQGDFEKPAGKLSVELDCSKYTEQNNLNSNTDNDFKLDN